MEASNSTADSYGNSVSLANGSHLNKTDSTSQILSQSFSGEIDGNLRESVGEQSVQRGTHWVSAAFLLISAALGAGLLNFPNAYDTIGGVWLSTILQFVVLIILFTTMFILIYCADLNQSDSYHEVLLLMCGIRAKQLAAITIMTICFGISVTFLIVIGDQFDRIFATFIGPKFCHEWYLHRYFIITITTLVCIWPMTYFKRLDFLKHFNLLGIFAILYVVFLNVYEYYMLDVIAGPVKTRPDSILTLFSALPVICFSYQTHELVVPVYACMSERKISSFIKATALALTLLLILYCISGTFGYLTFGSNVTADIMQMYNAKDPVVIVGIIALILKMITTYPQLLFVGRDTFVKLIFKESSEQSVRKEFCYRIITTTVWNSVVLLTAIVTPHITIAIQFIGSLDALNGFIFPGLCMVSLAKRQINIWSLSRYLTKLIMFYGIVIIIIGGFMFVNIIIIAINSVKSENDSSKLCQ